MTAPPAPRRLLAAAVALGAALRITRLATKWHHPLGLNDSLYFSAQGYQLAHGELFLSVVGGRPAAEHGPLTAVLLAPMSWMSQAIPWQRTVTTAAGIVAVLLLGLVGEQLGRSLGRPQIGAIAALIAAVYPNLWLSDGLVMSESFVVVGVAAVLLAVLRGWIATTGRAATLGVLCGLVVLTRSEFVLVVAGLAIWLLSAGGGPLRDRATRVALLVAGTAVCIAPWAVFNATRFAEPVLLTTNEGGVLSGANCADTYYGPDLGGWSLTCMDAPVQGRSGDAAQLAGVRRDAGLRYAGEHLRRAPVVVAARLARALDVYGIDRNVAQDVGEERERWAVWAGIVAFWLLVPLAAVGLGALGAPRRWLVAIPMIAAMATVAMAYGAHRLRVVGEPSLVVAAAVGVAVLLSRLRPSRPQALD